MTKVGPLYINIRSLRIMLWRNSYLIPSPGFIGLDSCNNSLYCFLRFEDIEIFDNKDKRNVSPCKIKLKAEALIEHI